MTPALIASIVTSVVALITAFGLWIKSRANMNNELTKIIADRASTKVSRDQRFDTQDLEIANIKKDMEHQKETSARLQNDLEKNTAGLKDDINDLKNETNAKLNQLDNKITAYQSSTSDQLKEMMNQMTAGFKENAIQIGQLNGKMGSMENLLLQNRN